MIFIFLFILFEKENSSEICSCRLCGRMQTKQRNEHVLEVRTHSPLENSGFILRTLWALSGFTNQTMGCPNTATLRLRTNYVGEYPILPTWISGQSYKYKDRVVIPIQIKQSYENCWPQPLVSPKLWAVFLKESSGLELITSSTMVRSLGARVNNFIHHG